MNWTMSIVRALTMAVAGGVLLAACGASASDSSGASAVDASPSPGAGAQSVNRVLATPQLANGVPLALYVGADYCPFCASMRWPLVRALSRFGTFSGLGQRQSTVGVDGFPAIATYDFNHITYQSQYVAFQAVETADANGNPLQQPDATQASLLNRFDANGSIPFVFVGRYTARLPYSPALLEGRSFQQIQDDAGSANPDQLGRAIDDEADMITALVCAVDGAQPAAVCSSAHVHQLIIELSP